MYDVVFLHPPVSFKKLDYPLSGLFESSTGTTDLLTMMPLGMLSLANELHAGGFKVVLVNIAKVIQGIRGGDQVTIEAVIRQYPAPVYGIDLHWAAHAPGAIELARLCKKLHPGSFVLLGGFTATYFALEILRDHPFVDGIVQAECDGRIIAITQALLEKPPRLDGVPNLVYRDGDRVVRNPVHPPLLDHLDYLDTHGLIHPRAQTGRMERESLVVNLPVVRGCNQSCQFCGGSKSAYQQFFFRDRIGMMPVESVVDHIERGLQMGIGAVKLFGDVRLGGTDYVKDLIDALEQIGPRLLVFLELFWPASRDFLETFRRVSAELFLTISPESADAELRRIHHKNYSNQDLLEQARWYRELDIVGWFCFAYLLPGHTGQKLSGELDFIQQILAVNPSAGIMFQPYLFLDPGCAQFESPEQYGFTVTMSTFNKIRAGIERAYWYHTIGYRTDRFSQGDFHRAILDITRRKTLLYFDNRRLSARDVLKTLTNLDCNRRIGALLEAQPQASDEWLQQTIETVFPAYLRRSNSNLMIRPFFGEPTPRSTPESMLCDAFPAALELLCRARRDDIDEIHQTLEQWNRTHTDLLGSFFQSPKLPRPIADLLEDLLRSLDLPQSFLAELLEFEWNVFRLIHLEKPVLDGDRFGDRGFLKNADYDLLSIDEMVTTILETGRPKSTPGGLLLFDVETRQVHALNFDPRSMDNRIENAHIRMMSMVERRMVRMDQTVLKVVSALQRNPCPLKPRVLCDGSELTRARLADLLPAFGEPCS